MNNLNNTIFLKGEKVSTDYFTGTAWIYPLAPNDDIFNCQILNITFEPGARSNWHTHPGGQILLITEGTGYYQEKGRPIQLLHKGDVITILPDVEHWHGATSDSQLTHIAINTNSQKGATQWLEQVTEEEYNNFK